MLWAYQQLRVFHGLIAVAPLKHLVLLVRLRFARRFPRPNSRGPIEASPGFRSPNNDAVFHGLIAVAPLKPQRVAEGEGDPLVFHGLIAVAPLKHRRRRRHLRCDQLFSTA